MDVAPEGSIEAFTLGGTQRTDAQGLACLQRVDGEGHHCGDVGNHLRELRRDLQGAETSLQCAEQPEDRSQYVSHSYIAGPDFPRMARIWARTDDPFGSVTAEIDLGRREVLRIREVRQADGNRAHISRLVAQEYAALADAREPADAAMAADLVESTLG